MNLNDLPDEILLEIFSRLPIGSLTDLSGLILTCKKWHRVLWSKQFFQHMNSFQYQSRFLVYHHSLNKKLKQNALHEYPEPESCFTTPYLEVDGDRTKFKQDIQNCPLTNMTISMWCRTLDQRNLWDNTILLLWHYHLGYIGLYQDVTDHCALVKCTYTQQHRLATPFVFMTNVWYHIAMVINETSGLQLYINGNRVGNWPLQKNINQQHLVTAPCSSIWLASHCGACKWYGSFFDICLWRRCLEPYELKEMARTRRTIEETNFVSDRLL